MRAPGLATASFERWEELKESGLGDEVGGGRGDEGEEVRDLLQTCCRRVDHSSSTHENTTTTTAPFARQFPAIPA